MQSVKTTSINVAWTFKTTPHCENGTDLDPLKQPKGCIEGKDLENVKRLNIYESYMLQIHDRFYLKYSKCDNLVKYSLWEQERGILSLRLLIFLSKVILIFFFIAKLYQSVFEKQKNEENMQSEQNKQQKNNTVASSGHEATPSPSAASSSRHIFKIRRLSSKSSSQRLNRSLGENDPSNTSLKLNTTTITTGKRPRSNDETWETLEDETEEEVPQESQEVNDTTELVGEVLHSETSRLNAFASQAARIVSRNFKRRPNKKKSRPSKKTSLQRKGTDPNYGDELVVETLVVYSTMTVVWQDGTVETDIPSTELYPIHHLDNHEFFPGDFVSKANDYSTSQSDYGVIQSVDHDERIAKVKWFNIYGNLDNPV